MNCCCAASSCCANIRRCCAKILPIAVPLHLLVDEFQDVDDLQNAWLKLLAGGERPLFVVGDDDQSIYGWRGARPRHILDFQKNHKNVQVWPLEQNYRSTSPVLEAANALIGNNYDRLKKEPVDRPGRTRSDHRVQTHRPEGRKPTTSSERSNSGWKTGDGGTSVPCSTARTGSHSPSRRT